MRHKMLTPFSTPIETFICYSSNDHLFYEQLLTHLLPLQQQHILELKYNRKIGLGAEWRQHIHPGLASARLILLLISQDFISSGYLSDTEMQQALKRYEHGETAIISILVRPALWENTPLRNLPFLPALKLAVSRSPDQEQALQEIVQGITLVYTRLQGLPVGLSRPTMVAERPALPAKEAEKPDLIKDVSKPPLLQPASKVFVCYSHRDASWLKRLQVHLKPLEREGLIDLWDDTKLIPGSNWHEEIQQTIEASTVAVLLVSANFLASEFISTDELPQILTRAESGGTRILPLIVSPCLFADSELGIFQPVNPPERSLLKMKGPEREEALVNLAMMIKKILQLR
jgi:TIR domain